MAAALASHDGVLALGGGAILAEENRAALVGHTVVYLSVELPDAVKRVGLGAGRPLLAINPRATLRYLLDQRRPLYTEVATATVVTDGRTPEESPPRSSACSSPDHVHPVAVRAGRRRPVPAGCGPPGHQQGQGEQDLGQVADVVHQGRRRP